MYRNEQLASSLFKSLSLSFQLENMENAADFELARAPSRRDQFLKRDIESDDRAHRPI